MAAKTRAIRRSFPLALLALALAGCATPETRLRTGLANAGLSNAMAACMAGRMVDRLSLLQLRRLSSLDGLKGRRIADLTPDQFLNKVRALGDRSEEHTSELQSLMRISYAVFCLKKKTTQHNTKRKQM